MSAPTKKTDPSWLWAMVGSPASSDVSYQRDEGVFGAEIYFPPAR